ncbi:MAG: arginase family protein [Flavobacteriales bacterium]
MLVFIALRDYEAEEKAIIEEFRIKVIAVKELREKGGCCRGAGNPAVFEGLRPDHVSFDVDSLDPSISVGTGTPVPDGLFADEASTLLQGFCADPRTATLDVVEIDPALDTNNDMAEATLGILEPLFPILRSR